ncbi:MAG: hypothetical protein ACOYT8_05240 [Candidatus Dependentiae bacterium]
MKSAHLFSSFTSALTWNALLFSCTKIAQLLSSYCVYYCGDTFIFYQWSHSLALLYLILLWLDCGLKKSIARFALSLLQQSHSLIKKIIYFQLALLGVASLGIFFFHRFLFPYFSATQIILYLTLFIAQGIVFLLQNISHAYFLNKQFNCVLILVTAIEILGISYIAFTCLTLEKLLMVKLLTTGMAVLITGINLKRFIVQQVPFVGSPTIENSFTKHTGIMGVTTILKSLSERNFLLPFFAATLGIESATLYKITNDAALACYRIVVKSLGSADTAFLSYANELGEQNFFNKSVIHLKRKVMLLTIPLIMLLMLLLICLPYIFDNQFFVPLLILICSYIAESLLLPYERILEVQGRYKELITSYIVYGLGYGAAIVVVIVAKTGLLFALVAIQTVRLVSMVIMWLATKKVKWQEIVIIKNDYKNQPRRLSPFRLFFK